MPSLSASSSSHPSAPKIKTDKPPRKPIQRQQPPHRHLRPPADGMKEPVESIGQSSPPPSRALAQASPARTQQQEKEDDDDGNDDDDPSGSSKSSSSNSSSGSPSVDSVSTDGESETARDGEQPKQRASDPAAPVNDPAPAGEDEAEGGFPGLTSSPPTEVGRDEGGGEGGGEAQEVRQRGEGEMEREGSVGGNEQDGEREKEERSDKDKGKEREMAVERDEGHWSGNLDEEMVPFHGEARVVAPVREFEEAHGGFMDEIMQELQLILLEIDIWAHARITRLRQDEEASISRQLEAILMEEERQETIRQRLKTFMDQIRSALRGVEDLPRAGSVAMAVDD